MSEPVAQKPYLPVPGATVVAELRTLGDPDAAAVQIDRRGDRGRGTAGR